MRTLIRELWPSLIFLAAFSALTGLIYPLVMTGVAQAVFPHQASGSLIREHGQVVGSELIGQEFTEPGYFWGRRSAVGYDATTSSGSNLGPTNPALTSAIAARVAALRAADPGDTAPVPVDLVTASGSGLDPDISPAAAYYQVPRVARARGVDEPRVKAVVDELVEPRLFGVLGEPQVNVLRLNRAIDAAFPVVSASRS
jgi:K+-transporting ATPase ATPase C chain